MPWLPVVHGAAADVDHFTRVVLADLTVLIAEDGGERAGFAAFDAGWLHHLYVAPLHWRSGIGSALLTRVMDGHDQLELWTFQQNEGARRFYRERGFREVEFTDGARNEERTPDVRLIWQRV